MKNFIKRITVRIRRKPLLVKPVVSGELPLTKDHICFDKGHAYFIVTSIDNGSSVYGHYKCSRCGHEDNYQYDYH